MEGAGAPGGAAAGHLPERMTVRVFEALPSIVNRHDKGWARWMRPFYRAFAVDDADGAFIAIGQGDPGNGILSGPGTFVLQGSVVATAPSSAGGPQSYVNPGSECVGLLLAERLEAFDETALRPVNRTVTQYDPKTGYPNRHVETEFVLHTRKDKLLSGTVQMTCNYVVAEGADIHPGQCVGTYSFRNHNDTEYSLEPWSWSRYSGPLPPPGGPPAPPLNNT